MFHLNFEVDTEHASASIVAETGLTYIQELRHFAEKTLCIKDVCKRISIKSSHGGQKHVQVQMQYLIIKFTCILYDLSMDCRKWKHDKLKIQTSKF